MRQGFTLIEIVIYFGLVSLILASVVTFSWSLIQDQQKQASLSEVSANSSFIMDKIHYNTNRAESVASTTEFGTNKGKLVLKFPESNNLTIDTYDTQVDLGSSSLTTTKVRYQRSGQDAFDLSSDNVNIQKFKLLDRSNSSSASFNLELKLNRLNPANNKMYEAIQTSTTGFTLNKRQ